MAKNFWENDEEVKFHSQDEEVQFSDFSDAKIKEKFIPKKIHEIISNLPGAPMTSKEIKEKTAGMTIPQKLKFAGKSAVKSASEMLPYMISPESGILKAAAISGLSSGARELASGATPEEAARSTLTGGALGGAIQGGFKAAAPLFRPIGEQLVGYTSGIKIPFARRLIDNPTLASSRGEQGYSKLASDLGKTLHDIEAESGKAVSAVKSEIPKESPVIGLKDKINEIQGKYNVNDVSNVSNDVIRFAKEQSSTVSPDDIRNVFGVKPRTESMESKIVHPTTSKPFQISEKPKEYDTITYDKAQNIRDLLGDFTRFGEKQGTPKEIAEEVRSGIGNQIDLLNKKYMPSQEQHANIRKIIDEARMIAGMQEDAIKYAGAPVREGVVSAPIRFDESKLRGLGNEELLASGRKESQSNFLNRVDELAGTNYKGRLADISTRTAIREAAERPLGWVTGAGGMGAAASYFSHNPALAAAIGVPTTIRAILQKRPELMGAVISATKAISRPTGKLTQRATQGLSQNYFGGEQ